MAEISLETLKNERDSLMKKLEAVDRMIAEYDTDEKKPFKYTLDRSGNYKLIFDSLVERKKPLDGFPTQETWLNQVLYLLENKGRFMSNHELAEALSDYHYEFNVDKLKRKVSVAISAAYKSNRIDGLIKVGTSKSAKDALWGFDKWLTDEKKIKEENQPFGWGNFKKIIFG